MAPLTLDLAKTESTAPGASRHRRHGRHHKRRVLGGALLLFALLLAGLTIGNFAYNAYQRAGCYQDQIDESGNLSKVPIPSEECSVVLHTSEENLRLNATGALVAVALLVSSVIILRKRPHKRYR